MEQVIFLHADADTEETLSQMQRSLAQRLVLVAPARMDRLRLSLLLRLARRHLAAQAQEVYLVSEDRLAQMLATRMGFAVAATLDEYRGLTPGRASRSRKHHHRLSARLVFPPPHLPLSPEEAPASSAPPQPDSLAVSLPEEQPIVQPQKPSANLEKMLVDGYLPNPAATPDLEEEEERAEREEHERLHYEIDEEQQPSRAEQEAEFHEEQIIARIFKTNQPERITADNSVSEPAEDNQPDAPARRADHLASPKPPEAPEDRAVGLRPMRTIDEILRERGRGEVFAWFERQSAEAAAITGSANAASAAHTASGARTGTSLETAAPASATWQTPAAAHGGAWPVPGRRAPARERLRPGNRLSVRPPGAAVWRRVSIVGALALSLLMTGFGLALIPSAEVAYHQEISSYNTSLLLDARPDGIPLQASAQPGIYARAQIARFDGILTAQAPATGLRTAPDAPDHVIAFPTQADADQLASRLQAKLQQWGEAALSAQAGQGDILGPTLANEETLAFPAVDTGLPAGISHFQVSVSLHLRATLVRRAALLQAAQQQLRQDVSQAKPGFAPQAGQAPHLTILSMQPAGPGEQQLELLVRVQAAAMIGPALTPEQVRTAIVGLAVSDAKAYLNRQPGLSAVSISVQPKWLNRLPIFSARIRINLEN